MKITLSTNISEKELGNVWEWMDEFPLANRDDSSPKTFEEFKSFILKKLLSGTILFGVRQNSELVGIIGLRKLNKDVWETQGIIFTKKVHRKGVAQEGMRLAIEWLKKVKARKVISMVFNHNQNIKKFLTSFNFENEGLLRKQMTQEGKFVDIAVMSLFLES